MDVDGRRERMYIVCVSEFFLDFCAGERERLVKPKLVVDDTATREQGGDDGDTEGRHARDDAPITERQRRGGDAAAVVSDTDTHTHGVRGAAGALGRVRLFRMGTRGSKRIWCTGSLFSYHGARRLVTLRACAPSCRGDCATRGGEGRVSSSNAARGVDGRASRGSSDDRGNRRGNHIFARREKEGEQVGYTLTKHLARRYTTRRGVVHAGAHLVCSCADVECPSVTCVARGVRTKVLRPESSLSIKQKSTASLVKSCLHEVLCVHFCCSCVYLLCDHERISISQ